MKYSRRGAIILTGAALGACATNGGNLTMKTQKPLIIAHRGASGYYPEHTLGAYSLAIDMGADYIEPDLVFTKDGHLICRHENEISQTTDVAKRSEFAARKTKKTIDGHTIEGWFTEDFTLAEIKTLRCIERLPQLRHQNMRFNGIEQIPTFEELLAFREQMSRQHGRNIGIYPETKHPSYFASIGHEYDEPLLKTISQFGLNSRAAPIFIQSFETENLKRLSGKTEVKLIQLLDDASGPWDNQSGPSLQYSQMASKDGLKEIAKYAYGVGPYKEYIVPRDKDKNSLLPTDFIKNAHAANLKVHPWTFRAENYFLPKELRQGDAASKEFLALHGAAAQEIKQFIELGVDGFFTDFADIGYKAVNS